MHFYRGGKEWTHTKNSVFTTQCFECQHSRRRGGLCKALMKMIRNTETGEIIVKQSQDHERHGKNVLTNTVKAIALTVFVSTFFPKMQNKLTPAQIRDSLLVFIIL